MQYLVLAALLLSEAEINNVLVSRWQFLVYSAYKENSNHFSFATRTTGNKQFDHIVLHDVGISNSSCQLVRVPVGSANLTKKKPVKVNKAFKAFLMKHAINRM